MGEVMKEGEAERTLMPRTNIRSILCYILLFFLSFERSMGPPKQRTKRSARPNRRFLCVCPKHFASFDDDGGKRWYCWWKNAQHFKTAAGGQRQNVSYPLPDNGQKVKRSNREREGGGEKRPVRKWANSPAGGGQTLTSGASAEPLANRKAMAIVFAVVAVSDRPEAHSSGKTAAEETKRMEGTRRNC
ncbi:hypothetical protein niasHT_026206 [Heterodera trifolii]|uniref:Uncharacterized protein n=1 Tax=Heterodera trifolii TaxID=157864 RepID=A0ABD2K1R0_9BILA